MKNYGHRFCRSCGRMFPVTEAGGLYCGSCPAADPIVFGPGPGTPPVPAPEPPAPVKPQPPVVEPPPPPPPAKPQPAAPRRRPVFRPGRTPGRNTGAVNAPRTLLMLRALADNPKGLSTPELAKMASSAMSWINALGSTRVLMLKQEARGRVVQAGTVEGNRTRDSVLWKITNKGRRHVRENDEQQDYAADDDGLPVGLPGTCLLVLGMLGPSTPSEIRDFLARDGDPHTRQQVQAALRYAKRLGLAEPAVFPGAWQQTERARAILADGDEEAAL